MKLLLLFLLLFFVPLIAFGGTTYPPGVAGWEKAADRVAISMDKTISNVCKSSKDYIRLSLSNNQTMNSRCEITRTIVKACMSYAQAASGFRMTNREGNTTPATIWRSLWNSTGDQIGLYAGWDPPSTHLKNSHQEICIGMIT